MTTLQSSAQEQLRQYVEQIERLEEEKRGIADDIRDKYQEAKSTGFDPKIMREIVRLRRMAKTDREEREAVIETYMHALGMTVAAPASGSDDAGDFYDGLRCTAGAA